MRENWNSRSVFLPYTGEPIDFTLEDRNLPIRGTFANGAFHSRWAEYDASLVKSWRDASGHPCVDPIAIPVDASPGLLVDAWKRFAKVVSGRRNAAPVETTHRLSRSIPASILQNRPTATVPGRFDSNQISS